MAVPIRIGLIHSQQGPMALSERPLISAALMAVEELNAAGGLLGRTIEAVLGDGRSEPVEFRSEAQRLLADQDVSTLFGCWTSSSRKAVKPVLEDHDSLLWYPIQYEGLEQSEHIVYTGSCLNQQVIPMVDWALASGRRRFALIGSDYVFPRTANQLIMSLLQGTGAQVVHLSYHAMDCDDFSATLRDLEVANPDLIINTINGLSNMPFFSGLVAHPGLARDGLVCSLSCAERTHSLLGDAARGQYACWGYFQSLPTSRNRKFVSRLRTRYGQDFLASDPVATAYSQVLLWADIVRRTGSAAPGDVRDNLAGSGIGCPLGRLELLNNHHVRRPALIGRCNGLGQLEVVWQSSNPIDPQPWLGVENMASSSREMLVNVLERLPDEISVRAALEEEVARRERMETELQKNQRRLLESEQMAMIGGFEREVSTGKGYWSDNLFRMLGYEPWEIEPGLETFLAHLHPDDRQNFRAELAVGLDKGRDLKVSCRIITKSGEERHFLVRYAMVRDEQGAVDHYHGTVMDVTERVLARQAADAREKQMRAMAEASPDAMIMIDGRDRILFWSHAAELMFGWTAEEVADQPMHPLIAPKREAQKAVKGLARFREDGQGPLLGKTTRMTAVRRNGSTFPVEVSIAAFPLEEAFLSVANVRDITARKRSERDLRDYSQRLALASRAGGIGVWQWHIKDDLMIWDELMFRLYKARPIDFAGTLSAWMEKVHPDDVPLVEDGVRTMLDAGSWEGEFRILWPDGEERCIRSAALLETDADSNPQLLIGVNWDVTEEHNASEQLRILATTDTLTGIFNRRRFMELAEAEVDRCRRYSIPFTMVMFDVDRFKLVNDTWGHVVGDQVLQAITGIAAREVREVDVLGRLGGEEFAIALPHTGLDRGEQVAERVRRAVEEGRVVLKDGEEVRFTVSLGVAEYTVRDCRTVEDLLRRVDDALYRAKDNGRNRVELARPEGSDEI